MWSLRLLGIACVVLCQTSNDNDCTQLRFKFNKTVPLTREMMDNGESPLEFYPQCKQWHKTSLLTTRFPPEYKGQTIIFDKVSARKPQCLYLNDEEMAGVTLAGQRHFVTSEDVQNENSPKDAFELFENGRVIFDDYSEWYAHSFVEFTGADNVSNYKAMPHYNVSGLVIASIAYFTSIQSTPTTSSFKLKFVRREQWVTRNFSVALVPYEHFKYQSYPCSVMMNKESIYLPDFVLKEFSAVGRGKEMSVCERVMSHCTGENQQFENTTTCIKYMKSLPHHDSNCMKKYDSKYPAKGKSFMCKYLLHYMAPYDPAAHCIHAGPDQPGRNGHRKCSEMDCMGTKDDQDVPEYDDNMSSEGKLDDKDNVSVSSSLPISSIPTPEQNGGCKRKENEELTAATVYTVLYCLPALNTDTCTDRCVQAISTFLGRFLQNGVACKCRNKQSKLLAVLDIDVDTLIRVCGNRITFPYQRCSTHETDEQKVKEHCNDPNEYQSAGGCKAWNWIAFESEILNEWDEDSQWNQRVTKSIMVASAECHIISYLFALKNNYENLAHVAKYFGEKLNKRQVLFHPSGDKARKSTFNIGATFYRYEDVVNSMRQEEHQERDVSSVVFSHCVFGGWDKLVFPYPPHLFTLGSIEHTSSRNFVKLLFPVLYQRGEPFKIPRAKNAGLSGEKVFRDGVKPFTEGVDEYDEWLLDEVIVETTRLLFGRNKVTLSETWHKRASEYFKLGEFSMQNQDFNKLRGYSLATAFLEKRRLFILSLRELYTLNNKNGDEEMLKLINRTDMNMTVDEGFKFALNVATTGLMRISISTKNIIKSTQRNPCELLPKWNKNPTKFVLEYLRLYGERPGGIRVRNSTSTASSNFYSTSTANIDETVFRDPLKFDPERLSLNKIVVFNGILGEMTSFKRGCPAHDFNVKAIVALGTQFLPDQMILSKCFGENRVMENSGVQFKVELIKVSNGEKQIEVYKYEPKDLPGNSLLIALHGFPGMPQHFAKLFGKLQNKNEFRNFDFWAPALPSWGRSSRIDCKLSVASKVLVDLVLQEIRSSKRKQIYLMGHGVGGSLMWDVAHQLTNQHGQEVADKISGLISLAGTHPLIQLKGVELTYYKPFLSDLNDAYLNIDDFRVMMETMQDNNDQWWSQEWENEHHLFWRKTGMKALKCYYRDNIVMRQDNSFEVKDAFRLKSIDPTTHILMIGGKIDFYTKEEQFLHTIGIISKKRGTYLKYQQIMDANHFGLLLEDGKVDDVADEVSAFVDTTWWLQRYLTLWSRLNMPVNLPMSRELKEFEPATTWLVVISSFLLLVVGFSSEIYIGSLIKKLTSPEEYKYFFKFAEAILAPILMACLISQSWVTLPLFAIGLFKMGYPEITTRLFSPFRKLKCMPALEIRDNNSSNTTSLSSPGNVTDDFDIQETTVHGKSKDSTSFHTSKEGHLEIFVLSDGGNTTKVISFCWGIQIFIHHCGFIIVYASLLCHLFEVYQVVFAGIALSLQHVFSILAYWNTPVYVVVELVLEVWLQLEVFFILPHLLTVPRVGFAILLLSHYLCWLIGTFEQLIKIGGKWAQKRRKARATKELKGVNNMAQSII